MSNILKISEAASMALHTMTLLAASPDTLFSTKDVASILKVSEAHLSKVFQRLAKAGLVKSVRGPKGGFVLGRNRGQITLLEIYEAIEGPLVECKCLMDNRICSGTCILGGFIEKINKEAHGYLAGTRLSDLNDVYRKENCNLPDLSGL